MLRIGDVDRRTLGLSADVNELQRAILQRDIQDEGGQQGDAESCNSCIAHEQAIVHTQGRTGVRGHEFPASAETPIGSPTIAVNDPSMLLQSLERSWPTAALEVVGRGCQRTSAFPPTRVNK